MDILKTKFGKSIDELQVADFEQFFITEQTETNRMEFKSYNPGGKTEQKLNGIISTICVAF